LRNKLKCEFEHSLVTLLLLLVYKNSFRCGQHLVETVKSKRGDTSHESSSRRSDTTVDK